MFTEQVHLFNFALSSQFCAKRRPHFLKSHSPLLSFFMI
nr:MAG TPA: hypothetical protein [Bacteriophage sp.]